MRDIADCGAKIMAASADLSHFIYRYELEWKDRVYLDADFTSEGDTLTVRCNFVNNTDMHESLTLNAVASMRGSSIYHNDNNKNKQAAYWLKFHTCGELEVNAFER